MICKFSRKGNIYLWVGFGYVTEVIKYVGLQGVRLTLAQNYNPSMCTDWVDYWLVECMFLGKFEVIDHQLPYILGDIFTQSTLKMVNFMNVNNYWNFTFNIFHQLNVTQR